MKGELFSVAFAETVRCHGFYVAMASHHLTIAAEVGPLIPRWPMISSAKQNLIVIDTGRERMPAGNKWHQHCSNRMSLINRQPHLLAESEQLVLCVGGPHTSLAKATSPGSIQHVPFFVFAPACWVSMFHCCLAKVG